MTRSEQMAHDMLRQEIALINAKLELAESHEEDARLLLEKAQGKLFLIKADKRATMEKLNQLLKTK